MVALAVSAGAFSPAIAGPPFETDDPAPTATHHWEGYVFANAGGRGAEFDGSAGTNLNYGLLPGVQMTATLPLDISNHDRLDVTVSHIDVGVKYRFWTQWNGGWSAALAPVLAIPVHIPAGPPERVSVTLPVWVGWTGHRWMVFGGGGATLSGEQYGRDSFFGGAVVARRLTADALIGLELAWHGAEHEGEPTEIGLALGGMVPIDRGLTLQASAGPRFREGEAAQYRFYLGLMTQF